MRARVVSVLCVIFCCLLLAGCGAAEVARERVAPAERPAQRQVRAGDWRLLLVNRERALPEGYQFAPRVVRAEITVDERIYDDLAAMLEGCRRAGGRPLVCSGYRSREYQEQLFSKKVEKFRRAGCSEAEAREKAEEFVAPPGHSEHETGLAVDIASFDYQLLDEGQADTPEQRWLMAHCHEYGFILRYPKGSEAVTGTAYEPWHYRYVGREAAQEIMAAGLTLEEYLAG